MKLIALILCLFISSFCIGQTIIDAAFSWDATTTYFMKGNTVVQYNTSSNQVTKTMTLKQAFVGMPFNHVDAALDYGNGKVYFFNGNQYARLDKSTGKIDANYPKNTSSQWEGVDFDKIDATVSWSNGKTYFFRKSNYNRYDQTNTSVDESYPKSINNTTWPGLTLSSVDAILNYSNGKTYFFKGDQYYRFDITTDQVDEGYPKSIRLWKGVSEALGNSSNNIVINNKKNNLQVNHDASGIDFEQSSWSAALDQAKNSGKLIFVDAYATWCGPCKWMAANVFPKSEVGSIYNQHFINYKMDCEKGDGLAFSKKYQIEAYPTLLFIDGNGTVVKRITGGLNVDMFIKLGKGMVKKSVHKVIKNNSNLNGTGGN